LLLILVVHSGGQAALTTLSPPPQDEVFHIPQAQAYCTNRFTVWDPKLTTPAGLYLLSYPLALVTSCTPAALRALNALGVALVLPLVTYQILRLVHPGLPRAAAAHSAVNVALFPLLFFFAGLYYTDVYSTVFVLLSYLCWLQRRTWASAGAGWVALWFRQTNVLWAVFLVVLEGVRALEVAQGEEKTEEPAAAAAVEAVAEESVV
jgi:alpha-1,2-glucosyltransferase